MVVATNERTTGSPLRRWFRTLIWLSVIAAGTGVALMYVRQVHELLGGWSYVGVFLIETVNSATIFVPTPGRALTLAQASTLHPAFVGLAAGIGATVGELTSYALGRSGRGVVDLPRYAQWLRARWEGHAGAFTFVGAFLPLPFDAVGMWAGAVRYPLTKFIAFSAPGKVLKMVIMAYAANHALAFFSG
jgi:membrane protein DedA with SNARE-associated domain